MRRHDISYFSLISGLAFGAFAIVLLATDGRFSSYEMHWAVIWTVAAGITGALLVTAAVRAILRERAIEPPDGFPPHD